MMAVGMSSCSSDDDSIMGTDQTPVSIPDEEGENKNEENVSTVRAADELSFFMTEALYGSDMQGRQTFFSTVPEEEKCLIINSEQEFREAYKGDKELPKVDFSKYTLVVGCSWGSDTSFSFDDFEMVDKGDSYQLNLTLNHNVHPDYGAFCVVVDIYFWRLYPKMESKLVSFNRIVKDVIIDNEGEGSVNARLRSRWILQGYTDADGTPHQVGSVWGDDRYTIQFKEFYQAEARINTNHWTAGSYALSFVGKGKESGRDYDYGIITLRDGGVTEIGDPEPLSEQFLRIFKTSQFILYGYEYLYLRISPKEYFAFRHEALK
jgi:hypothetical protein